MRIEKKVCDFQTNTKAARSAASLLMMAAVKWRIPSVCVEGEQRCGLVRRFFYYQKRRCWKKWSSHASKVECEGQNPKCPPSIVMMRFAGTLVGHMAPEIEIWAIINEKDLQTNIYCCFAAKGNGVM